MTDRERRALKEISKLEAEIAKMHRRVDRIRTRFQAACSHGSTVSFQWEHDDGYGRQSKCEGLRCLLCLKSNYYPPIPSLDGGYIGSQHWS